MVIEKQRTLRGVHRGQRLTIRWQGDVAECVTVWSGILLLARNRMPYPGVTTWRHGYVVGGIFWREIPHPMLKNPLNIALYPDTLLSAIFWPFRPWIVPGYEPRRRVKRWLGRQCRRLVSWTKRQAKRVWLRVRRVRRA